MVGVVEVVAMAEAARAVVGGMEEEDGTAEVVADGRRTIHRPDTSPSRLP
jgi:hypothetical protein